MAPSLREVELTIDDLDPKGQGVGRIEGKVIFVPGALVGERVRVAVRRHRRRHDEGQVLEILEASPLRVEPRCVHFGVCGGCVLQHLDPAAQVVTKQRALLENLTRIGGVRTEQVLEPLTGAPWGYRRRARMGVRHVLKKGRVLVGFRERGGRLLADLSRCEVLVPQVGERLTELAALIDGLAVRDQVAQIEVAAGDDRTALVLRNMAPVGEADRASLAAFGERHGFEMLLQPKGPASVETLTGERVESLYYELPADAVRVGFLPTDFIQVNGPLNRDMVDQALRLLDPGPEHRVLDLFCGLGNFTLPLARRARKVVGVEGDAVLVARARENARRNGLENIDYHVADLFEAGGGASWDRGDYDRVLLDPPRTGAAEVLPWVGKSGASRLVYVSCNPATLARDAGSLVRDHGFRLVSAGVMDLFPHTAHVESMALFER